MNVIKQNKGAFLVFTIFFIVGLIIVLSFPKLEIQWFTNSFYHPVGNKIFQFFSLLAEGWFTVPLLVFLLIKNWRKALYMGIIYGLSAIIAALLKSYFWGIERPYGEPDLRLSELYKWIPGEDMPYVKSFPSGHTTTAFCLLFGLALITKNKKWGIGFMVLACFIGLSRTYLSYHFLMDLIAGAMLGVLTALGIFLLVKKKWKF